MEYLTVVGPQSITVQDLFEVVACGLQQGHEIDEMSAEQYKNSELAQMVICKCTVSPVEKLTNCTELKANRKLTSFRFIKQPVPFRFIKRQREGFFGAYCTCNVY